VNQFEAKSAEAFVQHVAIRLIGNGYFYFVQGEIPSHKDPKLVDKKFAERYAVGDSKWTQRRKRERGEAKVRYLRFGRLFILVATPGAHPFFLEEESVIKDARKDAIRCLGYSIKALERTDGSITPSVRLTFERLYPFRMNLLALDSKEEDEIIHLIKRETFLWFSGVKKQIFRLLRELNEGRKARGLTPVFIPPEIFGSRSLHVFRFFI